MPAPPFVRVSTGVVGANGQATEDMPPDHLEGQMELQVILPSGRKVRSFFDRRTQMMDLLVQIATSHRLSPGDHVLQVTDDVTGNLVPFLPSTVLGALEIRSVYVVPKNRSSESKIGQKLNLPFEQTFRLKVYLPRNQLFVTRVSASTTVSTVLSIICKEKNLNPANYELRHPANREEPLHLSATLADYNICEVVLISLGKSESSAQNWTAMPRNGNVNGSSVGVQQPTKQKKGLFSFMFGKKPSKSTIGDGSTSSDSTLDRSVSPTRSQSPESTLTSPTTPPLATSSVVSAPTYNGRLMPAKSMETISVISDTSSTRGIGGMTRFKKRQAPAPPPTNRLSSPLSKEHMSKLPESHHKLHSPFSKSTTNLSYENRAGNRLSLSNLASSNSTSTSSILSALRKSKKAPPPPPNPTETEDLKMEDPRPPPDPDEEVKEPITSVEMKSEQPLSVVVDRASPVEVVEKERDETTIAQETEASETESEGEKGARANSSISSDSLEGKSEVSEISPPPHLKEELSYDDVANTSDEQGDEMTTESDTYEDIDLKKENGREETPPPPVKEEEKKKYEPVYAQVNKKKKNSKQEEVNSEGLVETSEVSSSPSPPPTELNSSLNDSAIEITLPAMTSRSPSPIDSWEYRIPEPPTPFKDLSSDEEVSDIVSDLLNTASFQEALLNSESDLEKSKINDSLGDGEVTDDDVSETGPETIVIQELDQPALTVIELSHEYIGESSTDAQAHLAINNLYEALDTRELKELAKKDASVFSEILEELSETLKSCEDEEVNIPPPPDTPPPSTSSETSRRSSVSESVSDTQGKSHTMRFSISTYKSRVEEEGLCYEKKLSRSESVKENVVITDYRPLRRRDSSTSHSSSTSKEETKDQNQNLLKYNVSGVQVAEPVRCEEVVVPAVVEIRESLHAEISTVEEVTETARVESPTVLKHEPVVTSVEEVEPVVLDLSKLEPDIAVVAPISPLSGSCESSRRDSGSSSSVDVPVHDLVSPLNLLLPAPSLFADDEDPEARRLHEEYLQFQQRLLAYQQKRLNSTSKLKEQLELQSEPQEEIKESKQEPPEKFESPTMPEKFEPVFEEIPPPPSPPRYYSPPRVIPEPKRLEITEGQGQLVVMLNEDHIRAFSEIIEEAKDLSPTRETMEIIPAPPKFESRFPMMLDGVSQTESEDSQSVISMESGSRPESRASLPSDTDRGEDDMPRHRYQGPPKIVLDTWRSRPSVHVAISTNPVTAYNVDDIEAKLSARKEEKRVDVKEVRAEPVKLKPVKAKVVDENANDQVERSKLNFETSRSTFEAENDRRRPNLVRRTSIDTPRPFELKTTTQVRRPMFNPVQVGNKLVQPKMPFRVPEVRGFPLKPHAEVDEKVSAVEKSRHDLIALARRPSADRGDGSEGPKSPTKSRDETDSPRKMDVVVLRKVSITERPKSVDDLDMAAPEIRAAALKPAPLKHAISADFQASFWNELNGVKLRPVAGKQTETSSQPASVPAPPCPPPPPMSGSAPVVKKSTSASRFQPQSDPRGELLNSIRNFGTNGGLKKTGRRLP